MQAVSVGVAQFKKLPAFIETRRRNFAYLLSRLKPLEDALILPEATPKSNPSWFGFPLAVRPGKRTRHDLVRFLDARKIATRQVFAGNLVRQPAYRGVEHRTIGDLAGSDFIMNNALWLGVFPGITTEMLDYVADSIAEYIVFSKASSASLYAERGIDACVPRGPCWRFSAGSSAKPVAVARSSAAPSPGAIRMPLTPSSTTVGIAPTLVTITGSDAASRLEQRHRQAFNVRRETEHVEAPREQTRECRAARRASSHLQVCRSFDLRARRPVARDDQQRVGKFLQTRRAKACAPLPCYETRDNAHDEFRRGPSASRARVGLRGQRGIRRERNPVGNQLHRTRVRSDPILHQDARVLRDRDDLRLLHQRMVEPRGRGLRAGRLRTVPASSPRGCPRVARRAHQRDARSSHDNAKCPDAFRAGSGGCAALYARANLAILIQV